MNFKKCEKFIDKIGEEIKEFLEEIEEEIIGKTKKCEFCDETIPDNDRRQFEDIHGENKVRCVHCNKYFIKAKVKVEIDE